jgi:hypothetical protein
MGVAGSSVTLVPAYKTTQHHTSVAENLNSKYVQYDDLMNR